MGQKYDIDNYRPHRLAVVGPGVIGKIAAYSFSRWGGLSVSLIGRPGPTSDALKTHSTIKLSIDLTRRIIASFDHDARDPFLNNLSILDTKKPGQIKIRGDLLLGRVLPCIQMLKVFTKHDIDVDKYYSKEEMEEILDQHLGRPIIHDLDNQDDWWKYTRYGIRFTDDIWSAGEHDTVLVASKAQQLSEKFAKKISPLMGPNTNVVVMVNGVVPWINKAHAYPMFYYDNGRRIWDHKPDYDPEKARDPLDRALDEIPSLAAARAFRDAIGRDRVYGCVLEVAAHQSPDDPETVILKTPWREASYVFCKSGKDKPFKNLEYSAVGDSPHSVSCLSETGSFNYGEHVRKKIALNLMNIVCAATNNGKDLIFSMPMLLSLYRNMLGEFYDVMRGFPNRATDDPDNPERNWPVQEKRWRHEFIEKCLNFHRKSLTGGAHIPSTLGDFRAGRKDSERAFLCEAIIELGEKASLETPAFRHVANLMNRAEAEIKEGRYNSYKHTPGLP